MASKSTQPRALKDNLALCSKNVQLHVAKKNLLKKTRKPIGSDDLKKLAEAVGLGAETARALDRVLAIGAETASTLDRALAGQT